MIIHTESQSTLNISKTVPNAKGLRLKIGLLIGGLAALRDTNRTLTSIPTEIVIDGIVTRIPGGVLPPPGGELGPDLLVRTPEIIPHDDRAEGERKPTFTPTPGDIDGPDQFL